MLNNSLPAGGAKEASLWENANLILSENTKNLEILEHINNLEILEEEEEKETRNNNKDNSHEKLGTPVNFNKLEELNLNSSDNKNDNELLITQNDENIEIDSNEKKSISKVIENINKFMDSNSSSHKKDRLINNYNNNKKHSENSGKRFTKTTIKTIEKKSSKKIEGKRLKDLIKDEIAGNGDYLSSEGNNADIDELKNKILRNNNFKWKKFKSMN